MGLVGFEPTQHLIRLLPTIHLVPIHKFTKYLVNNLPQLFVRTTLTITLAIKQELFDLPRRQPTVVALARHKV